MRWKISTKFLDWMGVLLVVCLLALQFGLPFEQNEEKTQAVLAAGNAPVVVVDAGHGGMDGGAVGTDSGVKEDGLNLAVAKLVQAGLREAGCEVIMTRNDHNAIGANKNEDMRKRRQIMQQPEVNLVVSIHMNTFRDRSIKGPMAFYMKGSAEGERLAKSVIESVCTAIGSSVRAANPGDYFVIRENKVPAVLVECGFLSNAEDEKRLQDQAHQKKLAEGIVGGIMAYWNAPASPAQTPANTTPAASPAVTG